MWRFAGVGLGFLAAVVVTYLPFRVLRPIQDQGRLTREDLRRVMRPWHTGVSVLCLVALGAAGAAADDSKWAAAVLLLAVGVGLATLIGVLKVRAAREVVGSKT